MPDRRSRRAAGAGDPDRTATDRDAPVDFEVGPALTVQQVTPLGDVVTSSGARLPGATLPGAGSAGGASADELARSSAGSAGAGSAGIFGRLPGWRRWWPPRLRTLVTIACVVAAAAAFAVYVAARPTHDERAVTAAIEAYTEAWNAHDRAAVVAAMAPGARFAVGESLEHPLFTAYSGAEFDQLLTSVFGAAVTLETTGPISLAGTNTSHATVPQRFRYNVRGFRVTEDGFSLYTLSDIGGTLKIAQHTWWRPTGARVPSMLWTS